MTNEYDPCWATKSRVSATIPETVDVAIVGAGLGGLQAGALLAQQGMKVAIFDQHYVAGGCCTVFRRGGPSNRYNFDIGLHYIGDCTEDGHIPTTLRKAGVELEYEPLDQDGFDTLVFPDFEFPMPAGHDNFRDRFVEMFPSERKGIDRYVRFLKEVDAFMSFLQTRPNKRQMMMFAATKGRVAGKYQRATLKDVLDDCTMNPQVRAIMCGQSGDYGLPPSKVAAMLHAGLTNHYFKGAYYPKGGGQIIADELSKRIEENNGSVHLRTSVEKIRVDGNRATGVIVKGVRGTEHTVDAKTVISNADLNVTFNKLIDDGQSILPTENLEMAAGLFMTCLGIKGDMAERGMRKGNYWQFDSYDMEEIYRDSDQLKTRASYITSASLKDPNTPHHAPDGEQTVEAMTMAAGSAAAWGMTQQQAEDWQYKKSDDYLALKSRIEEDMIRRVDTLFPGSRENITFKESATPMSHIRYTRASDGTGYGIACTPEQFFEHRPNYSTPVEGLFLAGANTRASHGVLGTLQSGEKAAKRVMRALAVSA